MENVERKVIIRKQDRINYILNGICSYYGFPSQDEFVSKYMRSPQKFNAKRIAMLMLYDIADCSLKDINFALNRSHRTALTNIWGHIQNLKQDMEFDRQLKTEYNKILNFLNL